MSVDFSALSARLFPQTVQPITPADVDELTTQIKHLLHKLVDLGRMTITVSHVDQGLLVTLEEPQLIKPDLHYFFLHYLMKHHGLLLLDMQHQGRKATYRFYKRP